MKALRGFPHRGGAPATSAPTGGTRSNNGRWLAGAHSDFSSHINQTSALSVHRLSVLATLQAHIVQIAWALLDRVVWALGLAIIAVWRGVLPAVRALLKTLARNHT